MLPIASNTAAPDTRPSTRRLTAVLLVLTLVVRGGVLVMTPGALADDPDDYRGLAENLVRHGVLETERTPPAYRPPLYPLVLSACVAMGEWSRAATGALHLAMGMATVWLVFLLGQRWGLDRRWAAAAAALVACDPILLAQSTHVMTETAATLLAVLALIGLSSASRRPTTGRAALAGTWLALAALCRPALLVFSVAAGVVLAAMVRPWPARCKILAGLTIAVLLVLSPWAIRNYLRLGRPVLTTTHGGYTLLLGNNPGFYEYLRAGAWGSVWNAEEFSDTWRKRALADELQSNRRAYAEARENIRREPGMFSYSCLVRIARLWAPMPHQVVADEGPRQRGARYAVGLWYSAELLLAVLGLWAASGRGRPRAVGGYGIRTYPPPPWLWGLLLAGCLTAVHTLYWSNMRMRAPLMPVVAVAAAMALAWGNKAVAPASGGPSRPGLRSPDES
jgi:4-amino-4-deoxy-L-arabinose transferase-like glycosyltransferase